MRLYPLKTLERKTRRYCTAVVLEAETSGNARAKQAGGGPNHVKSFKVLWQEKCSKTIQGTTWESNTVRHSPRHGCAYGTPAFNDIKDNVHKAQSSKTRLVM
jgi:hypothetical protein